MCHLHASPGGYILVHCTHGFNRSGYMAASTLLRLLGDQFATVDKALAAFAAARPPGIYKPYYVRHLFRYYHQKLPKDMPLPTAPDWKRGAAADGGGEDDHEAGDAADAAAAGAVSEHAQHDDVVGEAVSAPEADWVRGFLMDEIMGPDPGGRPLHFPGSQPVSLARSNLHLLADRRYWVTWKADGTRFMVVVMRSGTYLVDRSNNVTRCQMRWPSPAPPRAPGQPPPRSPVGPVHHGTILDGEMVVDEDLVAGTRTRRFLAYDMVALHGASLAGRPWGERWARIAQFVEEPRRFEGQEIGRGRWALPYDYAAEPFRVRRKTFWPLPAAATLLHHFIPTMVAHETDGLIFQPHDDPYVPNTHRELLKWKFAHMNSVDFRLRVGPPAGGGDPVVGSDAPPELTLELLEPRGAHQAVMVALPGARVEFPEGERPEAYAGRIVECAWDGGRGAWVFMRERRDKALPNARSVYLKVWASITDDIREEELLEKVAAALRAPHYAADVAEWRKKQSKEGGKAAQK
jgi:mRNA-capping enzyme